MPLGQVMVGVALCGHECVAGYRFTPPCVEDQGHLADEVLSRLGELSAAQQRADDERDPFTPPGEFGLRPLPD